MRNSIEGIYSPRKNTLPTSPNFRRRLNSSKGLTKCKTVADLPLSASNKPNEFYSLSRIVPNTVKEDKELLFEENLRLKNYANEILEKNHLLKINLKKLEARNTKVGKKDQYLSLVLALKESVKELNGKITEKEAEIHSLRRNIKTCKIEEKDIEIQEIQNECMRLQFLLKELVKERDIPSAFLEIERKAYDKENLLAKVNKEFKKLQESFAQTKEELATCKEKLLNFEKQKKPSKMPSEVTYLKDEIDLLKNRIVKFQSESYEKEIKLLSEAKFFKEMLENEIKKSKNLEKEVEDRDSKISDLEKQLFSFRTESLKLFEVYSPRSLNHIVAKAKSPPRLFTKLNELAKEKKLLIPVYLSLLDKNNNGLIEVEELRQKITFHGKRLKKKHIDDALKAMNAQSNKIPIKELEKQILKYEYPEKYESSSEEEVLITQKPRLERLKFNEVTPESNVENFIIPQTYAHPPKYKEKEVVLVKPEVLAEVFERIRLQMIEKMVNKNRCINMLFGNFLDPELMVDAIQVNEYLIEGGIFLGENEDLFTFGKFLIEPDGVEKIKESEYKGLRNKLSKFSNKLNKYLPDWDILDIYKQHLIAYGPMKDKKLDIFSEFEHNGADFAFIIKLNDFQQTVVKHISFESQTLMYLYLQSFINQKKVFNISLTGMYEELENTENQIKSLSTKHQNFIDKILDQLRKFSKNFESVFNYDKEILTNVENITQSLKSIDLQTDDSFISDIKFGKYNVHLGLLKALLANKVN